VPHKNCTQPAFIPQDNSDNYFSGEFPEFVSRDKHLNSRIIHNDANQSANSPIFRPRNNNPQHPDKNKSIIKAAFYAALERGRTIPNGSLLDREARRKWLAEHDIIPAEIRRQVPDGAAALLAVIALNGEDGVLESSTIALGDCTGMHVRNVQRNADILEERGIATVEERKQDGAKNLVNVYRVVSTAFKAWIARFRRVLIGWRQRHGSRKELESPLKPASKTAPNPAPKTLAETEMALRQTGGSEFTDFLLAILTQTRGRRAIE
jgi:hypothetical protein